MRLLLCCESYPPHRGGVQEVMRQIAERMAARGHDVTVATSRHPERKSTVVNGVKIRAFDAGGKLVYGLHGQIGEYRQFVSQFNADAILIMAAQQWSFDALWPILDNIKARKVFIPCGFSGLYEADFSDYFVQLPSVLRKFDHLIFNAEKYRDIDFVREIGLQQLHGAAQWHQRNRLRARTRCPVPSRLAIPDDAFLFLTVGIRSRPRGIATSWMLSRASILVDGLRCCFRSPAGRKRFKVFRPYALPIWPRAIEISGLEGWRGINQLVRRKLVNSRLGSAFRYLNAAARRLWYIVREEGWHGIRQLVLRKLHRKSPPPAQGVPAQQQQVARGTPAVPAESIESVAAKASAQPFKRVILTDLTSPIWFRPIWRPTFRLCIAHRVFSPSLFEAAAAGTAFLDGSRRQRRRDRSLDRGGIAMRGGEG